LDFFPAGLPYVGMGQWSGKGGWRSQWGHETGSVLTQVWTRWGDVPGISQGSKLFQASLYDVFDETFFDALGDTYMSELGHFADYCAAHEKWSKNRNQKCLAVFKGYRKTLVNGLGNWVVSRLQSFSQHPDFDQIKVILSQVKTKALWLTSGFFNHLSIMIPTHTLSPLFCVPWWLDQKIMSNSMLNGFPEVSLEHCGYILSPGTKYNWEYNVIKGQAQPASENLVRETVNMVL